MRGIASMQGAQSKAQKSRTTTLPLKDFSVSGAPLIQVSDLLIFRALYVPKSFPSWANTTLANSSVINIDLMCTVTFLHDTKGKEPKRRQRHKKNPTNPFVPFVALYCFTGMSKWAAFTTPLRWNCTQIAIKE